MDNRYIARFVQIVSVGLGVAGASVIGRSSGLSLTHLGYNPFFWLSLAPTLINLAILLILNHTKNRTNYTFWFSFFLLTLVSWGALQTLQRLSLDPATAMVWARLIPIPVAFMPVAFFIFTTIYTEREESFRHSGSFILLILTAMLFLYTATFTNLMNDYQNYIVSSWGFTAGFGPYFNLYLGFIEFPLILSLVLLTRHFFRTPDQNGKHQTRIFILSILVPLVGGTVTDGLGPLLHLSLFPTAVILTSVMAAIISYGMVRYSLFSLNPATLAPNILATMSEAVIAIDTNHVIQYGNQGVERLLQRKTDQLIGDNIKTIFADDSLPRLGQEVFKLLELNDVVKIGELSAALPSGDRLPVGLSAGKVPDDLGNVAGFIFVLTDISILKESFASVEARQAELEKLNDKLQRANDLMVGRELRMMELKKRLADAHIDSTPMPEEVSDVAKP